MRKKKRYIIGSIFLLTLVFGIAFLFTEEIFEFAPPSISPESLQVVQSLGEARDKTRYGDCWTKEEMGIQFLYLKGDPFVMGYSAGKLIGDVSEKLEDALLKRVHQFIDSKLFLYSLRKLGYVVYRDLPSYFPLDMQQEVYGYSCAIKNAHPELGSPYFRALHYQAAHDVGHQVMERFLSFNGCTSFAAWGPATARGHLIVGRNFDFEIGDLFDRFKVVQIVCPEQGIPFISISWAGMSGVVTGVNQKKLAVTLNAATSDDRRAKGTPVTVMARTILQQASTLEQAVEILSRFDSYISESFLVADGKTGLALVVEKSPRQTLVRKADHFPYALVCVNHFFSSPFQHHRNHVRFVNEGSSPRRLGRANELLGRFMGKIDPSVAAEILRDHKFEKDEDHGMAHLHTLNPSICSHSVIMDLTEGTLWVSQGPHQSGKYLAISIEKAFDLAPERSCVMQEQNIAPDPFITPEKVAQLTSWREAVRQWESRGKSASIEQLEEWVCSMENQNPRHFLTRLARGDLFFRKRQIEKARHCWKESLDSRPYGEWTRPILIRLEKGGF